MTRPIALLRAIVLAAAVVALLPRPVLAAGDALVIALASDVTTLDPIVDNAVVSFPIRLNLFNALTEIGPDGTLEPRLATGWDGSADARSWTFRLRPGATFHDGGPVTVDDVMFSYQKIIDDPSSPVRAYVTNVVGIDRVAEDSIRFRLAEPFALWPRQAMTIAVVSRDAYRRMGAKQFGLTPVGSGPYRLVDWVRDDHIGLAAFPGYWGGAPKIGKVLFRPVPSEAARASALLSGEVDIVPSLGPAASRLLAGKPGVQVKSAPGFKVVYLGFNVANPALRDLRMRQAIDSAIDRTAITARLLRNTAQPIGQIVSPAAFGYDAAIKPTAYDPGRARELVKQSGYDGTPIVFQYANDFITSGDDVAQAIAGYLQAAGITVTLQGMDYNGFRTLWAARKLPGIHMFVYGGVLLDADTQIMGNYATSGNRGYIFSPRVDALALQQRAAVDPRQRQALISEIWQASNAYLPYAYLYNEQQSYGTRTGVDWTPSADGIIRLTAVSFDR